MHTSKLPEEILWNVAYFLTLPRPDPSLETKDVTNTPSDAYCFLKARWADVGGFAMASKVSRDMALKNWFRVLHLRGERDFEVYKEKYPFIFQYTTAIVWHAAIHDDEHARSACNFFARFAGRTLRSVRIVSPVPEPLKIMEWKSYIREVLQAIGACTISSSSSPETSITDTGSTTSTASTFRKNSITRLEIYNEMYPSPDLARLIAEAVPQLEELRLRQPATWCNSCFTCNIPIFTHRYEVEGFKPLVYPDGRGLPALWASRLSALPNLRTVLITVAFKLTRSTVIGDRSSDFPFLASLSGKDSSSSTDLTSFPWTGECSSCFWRFRRDPGFLETTRDAKVGNSNIPPNLKRVEWRFLPISTFEDEDDNWNWIGWRLFA